MQQSLRIVCVLAVLLASGMGSACTGLSDKPLATSPTAGLRCVDDSPGCIARRQATLQHYLQSSDRSWIRNKPDKAAYASGVRLFAYKKQLNELSCAELSTGLSETQAAKAALTSASGTPLTPAQISRGKMLAHETAQQIRRERKRRCRG